MDAYLRYAEHAPFHDPSPLVAILAAATHRLGLALTLSTTFYPPFLLARLLTTLDHLSRGRIAWNVVTSYKHEEALNFGYQELLDHDSTYNLYEYDFNRPEGEKLALLSPDAEPAKVEGVVRISPDGSHVYFVAQGVLTKFHPKFSKGQVLEHHDFGRSFFWNEGGAIQWHYDEAYEIRDLVQKYGREHIAAEAQRVLEEQVQEIIYPWMEKEGTRNLSCSGGVFLNVKLNQRIWESGRVTRHHIYPNAGDSGLAVGAALYAYYQVNPSAPIDNIEDLYWGPEYSETEIEAALKLRNLLYRRVENIEEYVAKQLAEGKIISWFQGRMESGPRALGNRSILMSANQPQNKDTINARVKFREAFRPFCPSMLWENRADYLENPRDEFFMITSFTCVEGKRKKVPAVVHADATLRPQTVKKEFNPRFWNLINEFGKLSDEPLLLNTSFNIMGEPIVTHPREAVRCFYDNGLDCLALGNFVLEKNNH